MSKYRYPEIEPAEVLFADYKPTESQLAQFRYWHVEPLLNQAADLLDRCLGLRAQYNALRAQWFHINNEIQFGRRDREIYLKRKDAGHFT